MNPDSNFPERYTAPRLSTRTYVSPQITIGSSRPLCLTRSHKEQLKAASSTKPKNKFRHYVPRSLSDAIHRVPRRARAPRDYSFRFPKASRIPDLVHVNYGRAPIDYNGYRKAWMHKTLVLPPDMPPLDKFIKCIDRQRPVAPPSTVPTIPDIPDSEFSKLFKESLSDADDWSGYMNAILAEGDEALMDEEIENKQQ